KPRPSVRSMSSLSVMPAVALGASRICASFCDSGSCMAAAGGRPRLFRLEGGGDYGDENNARNHDQRGQWRNLAELLAEHLEAHEDEDGSQPKFEVTKI